MKQKAITYILIVSVIAVWGIIFYRVLAANADDGENKPLARVEQKKAIEYYQLPDTTTLVLNYRDPFLGTAATEPEDTVKVIDAGDLAMDIATTPPAEINWDFIKYSGFIINPATKRLVSIMSINDNEKMMAVGEVSSGVKLLSNLKDSVRVSYQGKTKYIVLK